MRHAADSDTPTLRRRNRRELTASVCMLEDVAMLALVATGRPKAAIGEYLRRVTLGVESSEVTRCGGD